MIDTLAVALRVAEEAIEEAISKAEAHADSLVGPSLGWREDLGVGVQGARVPAAVPRAALTAFLHPLPLQDKQNEATYLRDHREELTEELAATILQKVRVLARARAAQGAVPMARAGTGREAAVNCWPGHSADPTC